MLLYTMMITGLAAGLTAAGVAGMAGLCIKQYINNTIK
jgi:hypothetical protein